jgi:hypothetical protein
VYLELVPLTLVDEGDVVVVGDPRAGQFISVPAVGGVVIRALQRGAGKKTAAVQQRRWVGAIAPGLILAGVRAGVRDRPRSTVDGPAAAAVRAATGRHGGRLDRGATRTRNLYLGGRLIMAGYVLVFAAPVFVTTARWAITG